MKSKITTTKGLQNKIKKLINVCEGPVLDLTNIDVSKIDDIVLFDTGGGRDLYVYDFTKITTIDISGWDLSNSKHISFGFWDHRITYSWGVCDPDYKELSVKYTQPIELKCDNVKWPKVVDLTYLFQSSNYTLSTYDKFLDFDWKVTTCFGAYSDIDIIKVDKLNWDLSECESMKWMFHKSDKLESVSGFKTTQYNKLVKCCGMFQGCQNLTTVDININSDNMLECVDMFLLCYKLQNCRITNSQLKGTFFDMFYGCKNLEYIDLSQFDFGNYKYPHYDNWTGMFSGCIKLNVNMSNIVRKMIENGNVIYALFMCDNTPETVLDEDLRNYTFRREGYCDNGDCRIWTPIKNEELIKLYGNN